jgi:hypothetical protein
LPAFSFTSVGCQASKNHSPLLAKSAWRRASICRNATASRMQSVVRAIPEGPSIIAALTSLDAMIAYCGEVDACSMKDSLKRSCGIGRRPSRIWM